MEDLGSRAVILVLADTEGRGQLLHPLGWGRRGTLLLLEEDDIMIILKYLCIHLLVLCYHDIYAIVRGCMSAI